MTENLEEEAKRCPLKGNQCDRLRRFLGLVDSLQLPMCPDEDKDYAYLGCGFYKRHVEGQKADEKGKRAAEIATELITGEDHGPMGPNPFVKRGQGPGDAGIGPHPFRKY